MDETHIPVEAFLTSPYLQTTAVLPDPNQYIYLTQPPENQGRIEHSFIKVGGSFMVGGAIGLLRGFFEGQNAALGQRKYIRNTIIINYMVKRSTLANSLGLITLIYAGVEALLNETELSKVDEVKQVAAGTTTGLLYQSAEGFRKSLLGGLVGLSLSSLAVAWTIKGRLHDTYEDLLRKIPKGKLSRESLECEE